MKFTVFFSLALFVAALTATPAHAVTVLRYTDHEPLGNMRTRFINDIFFAAIATESQGRLRVEAHWNGELSTSYEALRTVQQGERADMGIVVPEYTPEQLPLHQIFKSFPLGPENGEKQVQFFHRVFHDLPEFSAELKRNQLVNLQFFLGYPAAFFSTHPDMSPGALQGSRWRTASFWHQAYLENAGGRVVKMPWDAGITAALAEGRLDGLLVNLDSGDDIHAQRAARFIRYSPRLWLGHVYLLAMNARRWDSLAAEDRAAIRRAAAIAQQAAGAQLDDSLKAMVAAMAQEGAQVRELTTDELRQWQAASRYQQVQAGWAAEQEQKGVSDAGPVMQRVAGLLAETTGQL